MVANIHWDGKTFTAKLEQDDIKVSSKKYNEVKKLIIRRSEEKYKSYSNLIFRNNGATTLKLLENILTRATIENYTGINQKQLGHYLQGYRKPGPKTEEKIKLGLNKIIKEIERSMN